MKATHMVWLDPEGRWRIPAALDKQCLRVVQTPEYDGEVVAAWHEGLNAWAFNGTKVVAVPIRVSRGKYDHIRAAVTYQPPDTVWQYHDGGLRRVKERPWYTRDALAQSGRLVKRSKKDKEASYAKVYGMKAETFAHRYGRRGQGFNEQLSEKG